MKKNQNIFEFIWFLVVIAFFVLSVGILRNEHLLETISSFGLVAPLVLIFLKAMTLVLAPLGGTPLYIFAGALFGNINGLILTLVGDILGSSICFYISRVYGQRFLSFLAGNSNVPKILNAVSFLDKGKSFVKARIAFLPMPELLSYAVGLSKINFWKFSVINALFYLPVDMALVFFGSKVADFSAKYFVVYMLILAIFGLFGFATLKKDYDKTEGL